MIRNICSHMIKYIDLLLRITRNYILYNVDCDVNVISPLFCCENANLDGQGVQQKYKEQDMKLGLYRRLLKDT